MRLTSADRAGSVLLAIAGSMLLNGCGSGEGSDTTPAARTIAPGVPAGRLCEPRTRPQNGLRALRRYSAAEPLRLRLAPGGGPDAKVVVTVRSARLLREVRNGFGPGTFRAPVFLAITYSVRNRGPEAVEPAKNINQQFGATAGLTNLAASVDRIKGCSVVAPSVAKLVKAKTSPETAVAPGESTTTTAVYALERSSRIAYWASPKFGVRVALTPVAP